MLNIFSRVYGPPWRNVCSGLWPFFNRTVGLLHVESCEFKPLSKILANVFSHMAGSLSILLMFALAMQKFLV